MAGGLEHVGGLHPGREFVVGDERDRFLATPTYQNRLAIVDDLVHQRREVPACLEIADLLHRVRPHPLLAASVAFM